MKLTVIACKNAKGKDKPYKMAAGGGLYLLVNPNDSKYWRMKYRWLGKEKLLALGTFPVITLAEATEARDKAKKLLASDPPIDPMARKEENKRAIIRDTENSFGAIAREWFENKKDRWSQGYAEKIMRRLEMNVFPYISTLSNSFVFKSKTTFCAAFQSGALSVVLTTSKLSKGLWMRP